MTNNYKTCFLPLFLGVFGSLLLLPCSVRGQFVGGAPPGPGEWISRDAWTHLGKEYTYVAPEHLCPFTVEIYPEVLLVGDPLYIRMNFRNNTDRDAYAYARRFSSMEIERFFVEFHLKQLREIIPWVVSHMGDGGMLPVWQKIAPGKTGLTQYQSIDFPGTSHRISPSSFERVGKYQAQWKDIKTIGTSGQLVVVINNGAKYIVPEVGTDHFVTWSKQLRTVMSVSTPIVVRPRKQEEAAFLETINLEDQNTLKQVIPKLTPGTLQNLLKYQLLLWELKDDFLGEAKMSETQVLNLLEQVGSFLKPLHEIERENLKRLADGILVGGAGRPWIESRMPDYGEQALTRFIEVFGEAPVYPKTPSDYRGLRGGCQE